MKTKIFSKRNLRKKLKSESGETITETLVSLLVIVLALTMLAGAIVSSARINSETKNVNTDFVSKKNNGDSNIVSKDSNAVIHHKTSGQTDDSIDITLSATDDDNKYVFYEQK